MHCNLSWGCSFEKGSKMKDFQIPPAIREAPHGDQEREAESRNLSSRFEKHQQKCAVVVPGHVFHAL